MLNDEQKDHLTWLSKNPDQICGCGWFSITECEIFCSSTNSQKPEQQRIREILNKERKRIIQELENYKNDNFYPVTEDHGNHRYNSRNVIDRTIAIIKNRIKE